MTSEDPNITPQQPMQAAAANNNNFNDIPPIMDSTQAVEIASKEDSPQIDKKKRKNKKKATDVEPTSSINATVASTPSWSIPTISSVVPAGWGTEEVTSTKYDPNDEYSNPQVDWDGPARKLWEEVAVRQENNSVEEALNVNINIEAMANNSTAAAGGWDAPVRGVQFFGGGGVGWDNASAATKGYWDTDANSVGLDPAAPIPNLTVHKMPIAKPSPEPTAAGTGDTQQNQDATDGNSPMANDDQGEIASFLITDIQDQIDISGDPLAVIGSTTWDPHDLSDLEQDENDDY